MTPTLDELIDYAQMEADLWSYVPDSKLTRFSTGILHALKRLRELESVDVDLPITVTYGELIDTTCEKYLQYLNADDDTGIEYFRNLLHALLKLQDLEAIVKDSLTVQAATEQSSAVPPTVTESLTVQPPVKDSLTVQPTTEDSSATELSPLHKHFMEEFASKAIANVAASLAAKVVVESTAPVKDSLTTEPTIRHHRIDEPPDADVHTISVVVLPSSTNTPNLILEVQNDCTFKAGDVLVLDLTVPRYTPRPGVPTVEEVGDDEYCWVYAPEEDEIWPTYHRYTGEQIRRWPDYGTHWLPYDAIPMPEGNP